MRSKSETCKHAASALARACGRPVPTHLAQRIQRRRVFGRQIHEQQLGVPAEHRRQVRVDREGQVRLRRVRSGPAAARATTAAARTSSLPLSSACSRSTFTSRTSSTGASLCHKSAPHGVSQQRARATSESRLRRTCHRSQRREHCERRARKREQRIRPKRSRVHAPEGVLARGKPRVRRTRAMRFTVRRTRRAEAAVDGRGV